MASVVTKLLATTGPCTVYFGEKDYQQLCVVRQLVADLGLPARIVGCATVREADGLACSSRNARMSPDGRARATVLHRALEAGVDAVGHGDVGRAATAMEAIASSEPTMTLAYAAAVEPATLRELRAAPAGTEVRLLIAGILEGVRLLDNAPATVGAT